MEPKLKMWLAGSTGFSLATALLTLTYENYIAASISLVALFIDALLWIVYD